MLLYFFINVLNRLDEKGIECYNVYNTYITRCVCVITRIFLMERGNDHGRK